MMITVVTIVLVAVGGVCGDSSTVPHRYPGFTPIDDNCTHNLVELLLLRQEVHLSHLLDTESTIATTLTTIANTVGHLKDALLVHQQTRHTLNEECTSPWSSVGNNCFLLALGERLNWAESLQYCAARGGHLATYKDANNYVAIINYINSINKQNTNVGVWIGGTDEEVEGAWHWVTGEAMPMGTPFWGSTNEYRPEPNGDRTENCAVLHHPDRYQQHDITCTFKAAPLCQKDL